MMEGCNRLGEKPRERRTRINMPVEKGKKEIGVWSLDEKTRVIDGESMIIGLEMERDGVESC